jgi:hypothetical protein
MSFAPVNVVAVTATVFRFVASVFISVDVPPNGFTVTAPVVGSA